MVGKRVEITVLPGTNPTPDATELETLYYTTTDKVYFYNGKLRKLPGYVCAIFTNNQTIRGAARSLHSYRSTINHYIIGTNTRLYSYQNGGLYNVTPVKTGTVAIANSIATDYVTLGTDPLATTISSKDVVVTSAAHKLQMGDSVIISGVPGAVNGIPAAQLNTTHIVRSATVNTYTVTVTTTAATSTGSGGGAAVISATAILRITAASNGLSDGDRVKILGSAAVGGVPAAEINIEHIVRSVATNSFDIVAVTKATSSVSAAGGAATTYQKPIDAGAINFSAGFGYGGGLYGVGLYGVGKTFTSVFTYPRIWSGGAYGNDFICTPGGSGIVYIWLNSTAVAPTILSGAPTDADWVFIAGNIVVVLKGNRIRASDAGDATGWTPGPASYAYDDDIEGAGNFVSQATSKGINLIFTQNETYTFEFVDKPNIWETRLLLSSDGIIGPKARIEVEESVYWMGQGDFYWYNGASVQKIPNNTCRDYIYQNLNYNAVWKCYCRHDPVRNQVMFYFPIGSAVEPDTYMIYNYKEQHCTLGTENGTAAEENVLDLTTPYTADSESVSVDGCLKRRDIGHDADGVAILAYAQTNYAMIGEGDNTMEILEITPDSTQTGNVDMTIYMKDYAQSSEEFTYGPYEITPTTTFIDPQAAGRQRQYYFSQNALGEDYSMGKWFETVIERTPL